MALVDAMARGEAAHVGNILAAVTPGGGKSLLPVIAAHRLIAAGLVERVVWVVPRDSLRLQAEEAFADPLWRATFGHALSVRAADNERDPARGLAGYVTTYQAVAAAPALHLAEARAHRTLLVIDEVHHLPVAGRPGSDEASAEDREAGAWSRAMLPLMEAAAVRLHLSGTLERADGRRILGLPYRPAAPGHGPELDLDAPGLAVIGYSRAQALTERAVLPVTFGAIDGEASWLEGGQIAGRQPPGRAASSRRGFGARHHPTGPVHGPEDRFRPRSPERGVLRHEAAACPAPARSAACPWASRPGGSASSWWWRRIRRARAPYLTTLRELDAGRAGGARRPSGDLGAGGCPRGARGFPADA